MIVKARLYVRNYTRRLAARIESSSDHRIVIVSYRIISYRIIYWTMKIFR